MARDWFPLAFLLAGYWTVDLFGNGEPRGSPESSMASDTLMPLFPSVDPRLRFPGEDLPAQQTWARSINLMLLDNLDIHLSVFPSGHVTTGLATAFGLWLAWPERKRTGTVFFVVACAVALAAIYGRYHYAADALGGAAVSLAVAGVCAWFYRKR